MIHLYCTLMFSSYFTVAAIELLNYIDVKKETELKKYIYF